MPVIPSPGSATGRQLAQMMSANAGQKRGLAMQAQFAGIDARNQKMARLWQAIEQFKQQRLAKRAARGPSGESRIAQTLFGGTLPGALLQSDRSVSSGYQPNSANSLASSLANGLSSGLGIMGQLGLGGGTTLPTDGTINTADY